MAVNRLSVAKFLELIISVTCLILHYKTQNILSHEHDILISGTFVAYTVILVALFAGYILSTPINKRIDIFFSLIGAALFIATGSILLNEWYDKKNGILTQFDSNKDLYPAKAYLALANGILFFVDVVFTFRD